MMPELLGLLALIALVGAACFVAGWRSAQAYLPAARAVSEVANAAVEQANAHSAYMDRAATALVSLQDAIETSTKVTAERQAGIEQALEQLFTGLERAGLARSTRTVPRQHGEVSTGD